MQRTIINFSLSFVYAIFTYILQTYVNFGDYSKYKVSYESIFDVGLVEGYLIYNSQLGAGEPFYYLLTYIFSNFELRFEIFNSALSFSLFYLVASVLARHGLAVVWVAFILFPSYYLLVLSIDVIRLKVAIILFLLALRGDKKFMPFIFSALSQFQIIAYYVAWFFSAFVESFLTRIVGSLWRVRIRLVSVVRFGSLLILSFLLLSAFSSYLIEKINHYSDQSSAFKLLQISVFPILIGLNFGFSNRKFYFFIPLVAIAFFVGPGRVTIMVYAAFLYFTSQLRPRKFLLLNLPFSAYYLSKSWLYLSALIDHGSGFEYIEFV